MANWISWIDDSEDAGKTTVAGVVANGPTHGIGISSDLNIAGLSTFSNDVIFTSNIRLDGQLKDGDDEFGSSGQVLSSDGTDTKWVSTGSLAAGAAAQVAINDDSDTDAERFITLVDSSSGNNNVKTDGSLKYNPSTNTITTVNITGNVTGNVTGDLTGDVTGNVSGNAGTATVLQTARTIGGVSFNGSAAINLPGVDQAGNQNTSGNAATATKLAAAINIGGVSFDGSAAINLPGVNQAGNQNTSGNAATATVLATARNFSISGDITANAISFNGNGNVALSATIDNNAVDKNCMADEAVGEPELHISNSGTNGQFLQKSSNSGGLTWADVTIPSASTLSGNTLASGITATSITSTGTLGSLTVSGTTTLNGHVNIGNATNDTVTITSAIDSDVTPDSTSNNRSLGNSVQKWKTAYIETMTGNVTGNVSGSSGSCTGNASTATTATNSSTSRIVKDSGAAYHQLVFVDSTTDNQDQVLKMDDDSKLQWHPSDELLATENMLCRQILNYSQASGSSGQVLTSQGLGTAWVWASPFVTGMIMIWSGASNAIPSGWVLCNGSNSTPDLRNRFVVGAGAGYSVGNTGGADNVTLTNAQLPSHSHTTSNHNHSFSGSGSSSHSHDIPTARGHTGNILDRTKGTDPYTSNYDTTSVDTESATVSISISGTTGNANPTTHATGSGDSHENRPPYYALCYIMKT